MKGCRCNINLCEGILNGEEGSASPNKGYWIGRILRIKRISFEYTPKINKSGRQATKNPLNPPDPPNPVSPRSAKPNLPPYSDRNDSTGFANAARIL